MWPYEPPKASFKNTPTGLCIILLSCCEFFVQCTGHTKCKHPLNIIKCHVCWMFRSRALAECEYSTSDETILLQSLLQVLLYQMAFECIYILLLLLNYSSKNSSQQKLQVCLAQIDAYVGLQPLLLHSIYWTTGWPK